MTTNEPAAAGSATPPPLPEQETSHRGDRGKAGLVLGIIGLVLAFIPGALYVGIVFGVIALLLGISAIRRKTGRGSAALVLGIAAIVVGAIFASVYSGGSPAPKTASDDAAASVSSAPAEPAATSAPTASSQPTTPAAAAPAAPVTPAAPAAPAYSGSQLQAIVAAKNYLSSGQGFSRQGLIDQLSSSYGNGFPVADATTAVDSLNTDYNAQAAMAAKGYIASGMGFSHQSLIDQLTSSYGNQFTQDQATYAAAQVGL